MPYKENMDVIIVGGSLVALMHGLVLLKYKHTVTILERSPPSQLKGQASGVGLAVDLQAFVDEYIDAQKDHFWLTAHKFTYLDKNLEEEAWIPLGDFRLTTWPILYERLKSAFEARGGKYNTAITVTGLEEESVEGEDIVRVAYTNLKTQDEEEKAVDLVIAADGGFSSIRRKLMPLDDPPPEYAGYVLWRAMVRKSLLSASTLSVVAHKAILHRAFKGYMITYHVPSDTGSLSDEGDSQIMWGWYNYFAEEDLPSIMTDCEGKKHHATIPRGKLAPQVWENLRSNGRELPDPFRELLDKTTDPLVSVIRDTVPARSFFMDGKVLLVGDAFCLLRPNVGAAANQGARHARGLEKVLKGEKTLEVWEDENRAYAARTRMLARDYATYNFTGEWSELLNKVFKVEGQLHEKS